MSKPSELSQATVFCGIDVSAATLAVAVMEQDQPLQQRAFANRASGHAALIAKDAAIDERFRLLTSIPGIAATSALQIRGELVLLAPQMTVRQWVAHSGLDPVHRDSGSSVHKPSHISRAGNRHLRRALYMPALHPATKTCRWGPRPWPRCDGTRT